DSAIEQLAVVEAQCADAIFTKAQCYDAMASVGFAYGRAHQGLERVAVGTDAAGRRIAIADVRLPQTVAPTGGAYVLHPSIVDAALQATVGFGLDPRASDRADGAAMPFAMDRLTIHGSSEPAARVIIRDAGRTGAVQKRDVTICDANGRVLVQL